MKFSEFYRNAVLPEKRFERMPRQQGARWAETQIQEISYDNSIVEF